MAFLQKLSNLVISILELGYQMPVLINDALENLWTTLTGLRQQGVYYFGMTKGTLTKMTVMAKLVKVKVKAKVKAKLGRI